MRKALALPHGEEISAELEALNRFAKTPLTEEQVYLFSVRLCDNQIDRDGERFPRAALEALAPLFVGKSGLFDHHWSAKDQAARIYRTEIVEEPGECEGEGNCFLKGYAYMLQSPEHQSLIDEIEAGIKKEVSVSCAVSRVLCSICGNELSDRAACGHVKGRTYGNDCCVGLLTEPTDAYEWSFVAVPAQRNAGVMKHWKGTPLKSPPDDMARLEMEAALGRKYLNHLREDTLRLGLLSQKGLRAETLASICAKLQEEELLELHSAYSESLKGQYPLETQLSFLREDGGGLQADWAFQI